MTDHPDRQSVSDAGRSAAGAAAIELAGLVADASALDDARRLELGVRWTCTTLDAGVSAAALCRAAAEVGAGHVDVLPLAAPACAALATWDTGDDAELHRTARLAAVQLVARALCAGETSVDGQAEDALVPTDGPAEGPVAPGDPFHGYLDAALDGDVRRAEAAWRAAAALDPVVAAQVLISSGAAGYHLDETRLVLPAQVSAWPGSAATSAIVARSAAVRLAAATQDRDHASIRRADAAVLAEDAMERSPETFGRLARASHERLSILATGIALTAPQDLGPLLLASLEDGLAPEDLADAIALLRASAMAITDLGADPDRTTRALLACAGADAVQRCMSTAHTPDLRYELALCATEGPSSDALEPVAELWVPPFDDGAFEDLLVALEEGDSEAAAEAASAVPPDDPATTDTAWRALAALAVTDSSPSLAAVTHVVAMERGFRTSAHPARIWFLAAAARVAAGVGSTERPLAAAVADFLSKPG